MFHQKENANEQRDKKLKRTKIGKRENDKERERQTKIKRSGTWEGEK